VSRVFHRVISRCGCCSALCSLLCSARNCSARGSAWSAHGSSRLTALLGSTWLLLCSLLSALLCLRLLAAPPLARRGFSRLAATDDELNLPPAFPSTASRLRRSGSGACPKRPPWMELFVFRPSRAMPRSRCPGNPLLGPCGSVRLDWLGSRRLAQLGSGHESAWPTAALAGCWRCSA